MDNVPRFDPAGIWCYAWYHNGGIDRNAYQVRPASYLPALWPQRSKLRISFMDGHSDLQERVKNAAKLWLSKGNAKLDFDFRQNLVEADIRISFRYTGCWSLIGTSCREITDISLPTMNLAGLSLDMSDDDLNRIVLHEFGHALGLIHEHSHPLAPIEWDVNVVIGELSGPPYFWSTHEIFSNVLDKNQLRQTNFGAFDRSSIMLYPIPARWTLNGYSSELNRCLSNEDCLFISSIYR